VRYGPHQILPQDYASQPRIDFPKWPHCRRIPALFNEMSILPKRVTVRLRCRLTYALSVRSNVAVSIALGPSSFCAVGPGELARHVPDGEPDAPDKVALS